MVFVLDMKTNPLSIVQYTNVVQHFFDSVQRNFLILNMN